MKTSRLFLLIATVVAAVSCGQRKSDVDIRVDSILRQMTLSEKIGQMNQISVGGEVSNYAGAIRDGQVGSILNEVGLEFRYLLPATLSTAFTPSSPFRLALPQLSIPH